MARSPRPFVLLIALSDLTADKNGIIAVLDDGSIRDIIPSQPPKVWVKGLVKLEVQ